MSAGAWLQFTTASNQNSVLGVGTDSGSVTYYCNTMPWNPVDKCIEVIACDHNWGSPSVHTRYHRYDAATNAWILIADPPTGVPTGPQHGYDHSSMNPTTGDLYYRMYNSEIVYKKPQGSTTFAGIPAFPDDGFVQVAIGTTWWSGSFTGGSGGGASGTLMIFNSGTAVGASTDGRLNGYNPLTNTWIFLADSAAPFYGSGSTYHSAMEYSSVRNLAVYGGGNVAPNKVWRLNADGTHGSLTDVPTGKAIGQNSQGVFVEEPVTGNFLLLSAGELWELDPTGSGTWTQQTGGRVPPAGVGNPGSPSNNGNNGIIATSIAEYGVVVFTHQPGVTGGSMWIYKHA